MTRSGPDAESVDPATLGLPREAVCIGQISWPKRHAGEGVLNVLELGIERDTNAFVGQRSIEVFSADSGPKTVSSDGFTRCCAVILENRETGHCVFTHLQPSCEDPFERYLAGSGRKFDRAVFVYGSVSESQNWLERPLQDGRWGQLPVTRIQAETGHNWFGVVWNVAQRRVDVLRRTPDQSILTYSIA